MQNRYGFGRTVNMSHAEARAKIADTLAQEGFGILSEIDVAATFKKKLDKDIPPYLILGACNPTFASQAIATDPSIGLLLPCNIVVRQDEQGAVHVEALDPAAMFTLVDREGVAPLAAEVRSRIARAIDNL
jgi:uncharacterized protein (DUF302 family)